MEFKIQRESLLSPMQLVFGGVERRQTLPILSNILFSINSGVLELTATDLEVELIGRIQLDDSENIEDCKTTIPAKKLMDICRSLPDKAELCFIIEDQSVILKSGRSRFVLSTLSAQDFPSVDDSPSTLEFSVPQRDLRYLIERTHFAMAQQDVRYYLNGMLIDARSGQLRSVATDGHRLALSAVDVDSISNDESVKVIIPRKGVLELLRLLSDSEEMVAVEIGSNHVRVKSDNYTFTSKLIDGKFPDYDRVLPNNNEKILLAEKNTLKQALSRVSILSNEKYHGVRLQLNDNSLKIFANNPEQEEAEEELLVQFKGGELEIGFNVSYLLDVISAISSDNVRIYLSNDDSCALIEEAEVTNGCVCRYIIMPMRL